MLRLRPTLKKVTNPGPFLRDIIYKCSLKKTEQAMISMAINLVSYVLNLGFYYLSLKQVLRL